MIDEKRKLDLMKSQKNLFYLLLALLIFSCGSQKNTTPESPFNTELNEEYWESVKVFRGTLSSEEYPEIRKMIELELGETIPKDKAILINFEQHGRNCRQLALPVESMQRVIQRVTELSDRISSENNTVDYFIYTENVPRKKLYQQNENFRPDTGFFSKNIFTLHENCSGFFILKTNGEFMKYYGNDYFTHVKNFLQGTEFQK